MYYRSQSGSAPCTLLCLCWGPAALGRELLLLSKTGPVCFLGRAVLPSQIQLLCLFSARELKAERLNDQVRPNNESIPAAELKLRSPWLLLPCFLSCWRRREAERRAPARETVCRGPNKYSLVCEWTQPRLSMPGALRRSSVCTPAINRGARSSPALQLLCAAWRSMAPRLAWLGRRGPPQACRAVPGQPSLGSPEGSYRTRDERARGDLCAPAEGWRGSTLWCSSKLCNLERSEGGGTHKAPRSTSLLSFKHALWLPLVTGQGEENVLQG